MTFKTGCTSHNTRISAIRRYCIGCLDLSSRTCLTLSEAYCAYTPIVMRNLGFSLIPTILQFTIIWFLTLRTVNGQEHFEVTTTVEGLDFSLSANQFVYYFGDTISFDLRIENTTSAPYFLQNLSSLQCSYLVLEDKRIQYYRETFAHDPRGPVEPLILLNGHTAIERRIFLPSDLLNRKNPGTYSIHMIVDYFSYAEQLLYMCEFQVPDNCSDIPNHWLRDLYTDHHLLNQSQHQVFIGCLPVQVTIKN